MNSQMEIHTIGVLVLLTAAFLSESLVGAQSQSGFISLDCGLPEDGNYTAKLSGVNYISDEPYIDTGVSMSIESDNKFSYEPELWNVRSFPEGLRNCYNLKLKQGDKYLIRATFKYGNYDKKSELPQFDLYIGPNKWTTVKINFDWTSKDYELIHVLASNNLQICLVKSGSTTPFISALLLRPLSINTYNSTQNGSLMLDNRYFMSNFSSMVLGYPDDIHDRPWFTRFNLSYWGQINTSQNIDRKNGYDLPQETVEYAAVPRNDSVSFIYSWSDLESSPSKYQVFLHFAEVQTLKANEYREFNITFNGKYLSGPFSPRKFKVDTITSPEPLHTEDFLYIIGFQKTPRSTLPPILNAIEIYKVMELPQSGTDDDDVNAIMNIKATYGLKRISWEGDPCLPQDFLWDGLNCSYNNTDQPRITVLKLSASGPKGKIAQFISNLSELKELDLSNNNLTGEVPGFLAKMKSLSIINLSGNQLSGSVPQALLNKHEDGTLKLIVDGNPKLCKLESCSKNGRNIVVPIVASVVSLAVVIAVVAAFLIIRKKKLISSQGTHSQSSAIAPSERQRPSINQDRKIAYSDIINITNNFGRVLGQGGFGIVYHGYLNETPVAVKVLSHTSIQGFKQFVAEVELLLRVHHRNLVSLAGYCSERDNLALIYEYMANGDLKEYLSGEHGGNTLTWASRLRIVVEAAQGLEYLHNGCKPPMIHRDVKSTNILLNENLQAKLSDFGLSRTFPAGGESHVSTVVAGTPGYLDPEYFQTNRMTEKSDVYSFGVVLLEIITNQPVIDNTREKSHIAEWTRQMLQKGDINRMVDPKLHGDFDTNSVWKVIELAMACLNPSSSGRPTMHQVVMELNQSLSMELAKSQVSQETDFTNDFSLEVSTNAASVLMPKPR